MKKTKPSQFWIGTMVTTSRQILENLFSWKRKPLKWNLWRNHYDITFLKMSVWKRLSLSEGEIWRYSKEILYSVFCHLEKHFRFSITKHILRNISGSKGNQTMKFDQVIECNKRNIFLQKSCRKWDRRLVTYLFLKKKLCMK